MKKGFIIERMIKFIIESMLGYSTQAPITDNTVLLSLLDQHAPGRKASVERGYKTSTGHNINWLLISPSRFYDLAFKADLIINVGQGKFFAFDITLDSDGLKQKANDIAKLREAGKAAGITKHGVLCIDPPAEGWEMIEDSARKESIIYELEDLIFQLDEIDEDEIPIFHLNCN